MWQKLELFKIFDKWVNEWVYTQASLSCPINAFIQMPYF